MNCWDVARGRMASCQQGHSGPEDEPSGTQAWIVLSATPPRGAGNLSRASP